MPSPLLLRVPSTGVAFVLLCVAFATPAHVLAQCECDLTVSPGDDIVDGQDLGVGPGDRICVTAGDYEFIRFRRVAGTASAPVTITNCGGLVRIHNTERAYALVFEEDSHHFHLTGTGDPALTYGFEISAPDREPYPGVGLWLLGRSTGYEVDHVEIHDTGFAGVSAKTDPLCDGSADQDVFVQRDVSFHHMYVHDTVGEGFYIGSTQANGQNITCNGSQELHQPHFLEGITVTDSLIERTGWDGMQVGMARSDCFIARNTIRDVGREGVEFQQQGLQIGSFSSCEIVGNVMSEGPTNGLFVLEAADTWAHNNVIVGFAGDGIYANLRDGMAGIEYRFHFNTIVDSGGNAMRVFGPELGPSEALSNLAVGSGGGISAGGDVSFTSDGNVEVASAAQAGFVGTGDYHLLADSVARGAGVAVDGMGPDLEGYPRSTPPSAGAYEYRDPTVDAGPGVRDGGGPIGGSGGGGGGCSVSAPLRASGSVWFVVALVCIVGRRRRS